MFIGKARPAMAVTDRSRDMTSDPAEEPAQTHRTDVDINYLLALPLDEVPTSSGQPTPPTGAAPRAKARAITRTGQDQRDSRTSHHEHNAQTAPANAEVSSNSREPAQLFTAEQAASMLQVPPSWLRKKAAAGAISHTRIGRHLRFSTDDLHRLIDAGQCGPAEARRG
ncbi:helix-turn-helix domain-containing protein [Streptomyces sp. NPDC056949]|uniref:helix-turn-helix domain-containing protein n=1 Tax=Streptomyces sp. NPDC056949 TaxID=3345976 RepID=UPI0036294AE8